MKRKSHTADVFISVGATYTNMQSMFVRSFEAFLLSNNCNPRKIEHISPGKKPIAVVRQELTACDGAVIIAFTRYEISTGAEFPKSKTEKSIVGMRIPTMWNQLEGGMAYALDIPLLILIEKGLDRQGILEPGGECFPLEIELSAGALEEQTFIDAFMKWRDLVQERAEGHRSTKRKLTGRESP